VSEREVGSYLKHGFLVDILEIIGGAVDQRMSGNIVDNAR
jgi:hypothetical protein